MCRRRQSGAGLRDAYVPGRLEVVHTDPTVVLDGAHNPEAASTLISTIEAEFDYDRLILVMGMVQGHSVEGVVGILVPTLISSSQPPPRPHVRCLRRRLPWPRMGWSQRRRSWNPWQRR